MIDKCFFMYANPSKPESIEAAKVLALSLQERHSPFALEKWLHEFIPSGYIADLSQLDERFLAVLCVGGDGTMLRTIPFAAKSKVPILGINLGHTGFLMEAAPHQIKNVLDLVLTQQYIIEERMMLSCIINNQPPELVMNEVAVTRGQIPSSLVVDARADNESIFTIHGDGILVSTPTGTTGYSLSAGGPVVHPAVNCQIIVPVCSHIMQQRPVILPDYTTIHLRVRGNFTVEHQVSLDGQKTYNFLTDTELTIRKAQEFARFIRFKPQSFLTRLNQKQMEWSTNIYGGEK